MLFRLKRVKLFNALSLGLLVLGAAPFPRTDALSFSLSQLKAAVPITYGIYSIIVDRFSKQTLNKMEAVEEEMSCMVSYVRDYDIGSNNNNNTTLQNMPLHDVVDMTPAQLRNTISKRTNLVTDPQDRKSWFKWRLTPPKNNDDVTASIAMSGDTSAVSDSTTPTSSRTMIEPGHTYTWVYRSYVNSEERNAIASSFGNWKIFLLMHSETTKMIVHDQDASDVQSDRYRITLTDKFRVGLVLPATISWHGTLVTANVTSTSIPRITWNRTEAKVGSKTTENPAAAQKLSAEPWDIVKCEDGLVCFQRGDIGYLVFDKVQ